MFVGYHMDDGKILILIEILLLYEYLELMDYLMRYLFHANIHTLVVQPVRSEFILVIHKTYELSKAERLSKNIRVEISESKEEQTSGCNRDFIRIQ